MCFAERVSFALAITVVLTARPIAAQVPSVNLRQDENGIDASCWNVQDSSCTDGRLPVHSRSDGISSYALTGLRVAIAEPTLFTRIAGVGANGIDDYNNWNVNLSVFRSEDAFSTNPGGQVPPRAQYIENNISLSDTDPPFFGGTDALIGVPFRYLEFDFPHFGLQPGTYWFLMAEVSGVGFHWGHSTTDLGSDIYIDDHLAPNWVRFETEFDQVPGTAAVDIFGYHLIRGDYNWNGTVDAPDYNIWRDIFGWIPAPGFDFLRADGNGDGTNNAPDYFVWRANFGRSIQQPAVIPEPSTVALLLISLLWRVLCARTVSNRHS